MHVFVSILNRFVLCLLCQSLSPTTHQDVSRLVDLCRQSIYFDSIANIAACLARIAADPDVALARIKNRFQADSGSAEATKESAGFRNLAVNLRLSTEESRAAGADTHVCEVQLLLIKMAAIKVRRATAGRDGLAIHYGLSLY